MSGLDLRAVAALHVRGVSMQNIAKITGCRIDAVRSVLMPVGITPNSTLAPVRDFIRIRPSRPGGRGLDIAERVAALYGLTFDDLAGRALTRNVTRARHEAMWEIIQRTEMSTTEVGQMFGDRDHSSVVHACRRHEERIAALQAERAAA